MTDTEFQPVLPLEEPPTEAEFNFLEDTPNVFPSNQNSNFGFLARKIWTDRTQELSDQQSTLYNERFPDTSTQFLDDQERQYGLPINPPSLTTAQRRQVVLNRIRVGPFTRSRVKAIVESYISATFGTVVQITPAGIALTSAGVPLFSQAGSVASLYSIVENIPGFSYQIRISNTVTPDDAGMRRELDRITPAHIAYTIVYVTNPIPFGLVPAVINSTTRVSAGIGRRRIVTPLTVVNAKTTITGSVAKSGGTQRRITGGVVNSTTAVSGAVAKSGAPAAYVQSNSYTSPVGSSQQTSYQITLTNPVVVGDSIVVAVFRWAPAAIETASMTDNLGNVYTRDPNPVIETAGGDNVSLDIFTAPVTVPGSCTITASLQNPRYVAILAYEVSGGGVDAVSQNTSTVSGTAPDTITSGSKTLTANSEFVIGFVANAHSGFAFSPGTGFATRMNVNWPISGDIVLAEDQSGVSAGAKAATWSDTSFGNQGYVAAMVAIKPGGGGGGSPPPPPPSGTARMISTANFGGHVMDTDSHLSSYDNIMAASQLTATDQAQIVQFQPGVDTYAYFDYSDINGGVPSAGVTGMDYNTAIANGWIVLNGGVPVNEGHVGFPQDYLADIGNMNYIHAWTANVLANLRQYGNTGVFIDNIIASGPWSLTGSYYNYGSGAAASRTAWSNAHVAALQYIYTTLHAAGFKVAINCLGWMPANDPYYNGNSDNLINDVNWQQQVVPYVDVIFKESWAVNGANSLVYSNQFAIANVMAQLTNAENAGKSFVGNVYWEGFSTDLQAARFTKGLVLISTSNAYKSGASVLWEGRVQDSWDNSWAYDIGKPAGAKVGVGSGSSPDGSIGYRRPFTQGMVLVNTDSVSSMNYTLTGSYTDQNGSVRSGTVTVPPQDALFLHS